MGVMMHVSPKRLYTSILAAAILGTLIFWIYLNPDSRVLRLAISNAPWKPRPESPSSSGLVDSVAKYFIDYPLEGPEYSNNFGELGRRVQVLTEWVAISDAEGGNGSISRSIEKASLSMFPFIRNPTIPDDPSPLSTLRYSFIPGSVGIVIPVGLQDFRYACHLIVALRSIIKSTLPIQIAYAGYDDLPLVNQEVLLSICKDLEFIDILSVFDNKVMQLGRDWAIKPFAALASSYEQVILLDADTVFIQPPERLFTQQGYRDTGALFFHDRLLWQHAFAHRHEWWKKQMEHHTPSPELMKSLVWTQDYAEEMDSGVVVLDKGRLPIFTALLHVCWQLTEAVREQATYKMTYGDKESWWFGLELCGVPYSFESHYGGVIGTLKDQDGKEDVCSFTISHVDEKDRLFWFNGSLLKNKLANKTEFEVPTHWMMDATWLKGATKVDMSCMTGGIPTSITDEEKQILEESIRAAETVDREKSLI